MNQHRTNVLWIAVSMLLSAVVSVPLVQGFVQQHCVQERLMRTLSLSFGSADRPARDAGCGGETRSTQLLKRGGSIRVNETAD